MADEKPTHSEPAARSFLSEFPNAEAFIPGVIFAAAAALVSLLCWNNPELKNLLAGNAYQVFNDSEWYRVLTSILLHANIKHLLGNLLFLVPFAGLLTYYFGWRMFPVYALILGVGVRIVALWSYVPRGGLQGASGLLYVMFGLWLSLYYKAESHLSPGKRWLRVLGFGLIMFIPSEFSPRVSYRSHLIGLIVGIIAGLIFAHLNRNEWEQRNRKYAREQADAENGGMM